MECYASAMAGAQIELSGVSKRYGALAALDGVDLCVGAGEFVALVGGSGSGKTTLLKTVNGLIRPDAGRVTVAGEDVSAVEPHLLRRRIGYVFQEVGLFPHLTVAENITITPKLLGWDRPRMAARVSELLELVALLAAVAERMPAALSGGQRQRVGVARALAAEPRLMLMDEPFGALDPVTRDALGGEYRALHERLGLTTLMVTHDMTEAVLLADRIVVLKSGRIVADGAPADLLAKTEDPDVRALLEAPKRQAERLRERLGA
jgi:osmoprotectant transport system ATP-binding protein